MGNFHLFILKPIDFKTQIQSGNILKNKKTTPIYTWEWSFLVPIPHLNKAKHLNQKGVTDRSSSNNCHFITLVFPFKCSKGVSYLTTAQPYGLFWPSADLLEFGASFYFLRYLVYHRHSTVYLLNPDSRFIGGPRKRSLLGCIHEPHLLSK